MAVDAAPGKRVEHCLGDVADGPGDLAPWPILAGEARGDLERMSADRRHRRRDDRSLVGIADLLEMEPALGPDRQGGRVGVDRPAVPEHPCQPFVGTRNRLDHDRPLRQPPVHRGQVAPSGDLHRDLGDGPRLDSDVRHRRARVRLQVFARGWCGLTLRDRGRPRACRDRGGATAGSVRARGPGAGSAALERSHPAFQRRETGRLAVRRRGSERAQQADLDEQSRVHRLAQAHLRLGHEFEQPQPEPRGRDRPEVGDQPHLVGTDRGALRVAERNQLRRARQSRHIAGRAAGGQLRFEGRSCRTERPSGIGARQGGHERVQRRRIGESEGTPCDADRHRPLAGAERLLEEHERIAEAPLRGSGEQGERIRVHLLLLLRRDVGEQALDSGRGRAGSRTAAPASGRSPGPCVARSSRARRHMGRRLLESS